MNIIQIADAAINSNINSIKYTDKLKQYDVPKSVTIGWKNVLPEPPLNNSKTTKKELEYIQELTSNVTPSQKMAILEIDKEPKTPFENILSDFGLEFPETEFNRAYAIIKPVFMNLKYMYNRPRPIQLAQTYNYKINVIETETIDTPSYPSGHSCYAALCAYLLAAMYPEHSGHFFDKVGEVSMARMMQGVHYPSDTEASMVITGALWEDIRYKMFPEFKQI